LTRGSSGRLPERKNISRWLNGENRMPEVVEPETLAEFCEYVLARRGCFRVPAIERNQGKREKWGCAAAALRKQIVANRRGERAGGWSLGSECDSPRAGEQETY